LNRWGLGRTEPRAKSAKGIMQWAAVVEEVLDLLHIDQCSVMAHSAGAPYALSFANKLPKRIRGDICLLAPWVGGGDGGKFIVMTVNNRPYSVW
jgi:pimeloyl-ACP methyl ester carboxylesterase